MLTTFAVIGTQGGGGGGGGGWGWERTARNLAPNLFVMGLYFFVTSYGGDNFGGGGHGGGGGEQRVIVHVEITSFGMLA